MVEFICHNKDVVGSNSAGFLASLSILSVCTELERRVGHQLRKEWNEQITRDRQISHSESRLPRQDVRTYERWNLPTFLRGQLQAAQTKHSAWRG